MEGDMSEATAVMVPEPMAVRGISQDTHDLAQAFRADLEAAMPQLMAVLPKGVRGESMASMALTCALDNPELLSCEPLSLVRATFKMATLGLRPGETCDIVPTKKGNRKLAEMWPRVKGIVDLAVRAKAIQYAKTVPIADGDDWSFEDDVLRHRPRVSPKADGSNVTHMAAMVILPSGVRVWELWARERIIEHRDKYAKNITYEGRPNKSSPWIKDPLPMWGKTVLKSLLRYARLSPEVASAIAEGDDIGDGTFTPVAGDDPTAALRGAAGALAALDSVAQLGAGATITEPVRMALSAAEAVTVNGKTLGSLSDEQLALVRDNASAKGKAALLEAADIVISARMDAEASAELAESA
jgi:phage RecT family recombinase